MSEFLQSASDYIWGIPLLGFIFIANVILAYYSRFLPLRGIWHALKLLTEKKEQSAQAEGQISHFQAFCNAIAGTVGLGNISGVAVAIATGGPGALMWMWIAAIFGMNTKFFECTVAQMYRGKDHRGEIQGGAMYVIESQLPKLRILGIFFAICGLIGTLSLFQINQLAQFAKTQYGVPEWNSGVVFGILVALILWRGLTGITRACSVIVPMMSLLYFITIMVIIVMNYVHIPRIIQLIFSEAFNPSSAFGGITGYGFMHILTTGMKRATFSNEAGIGTAPMAHSNSKTSEPISEGYVAMLGPFLDTIIVCSLTAFAILVTFPEGAPQGINGVTLSTLAFTTHLGIWGKHLLAVAIILFAFSTMLGMANYNQKCWDYLFRGRWGMGQRTFVLIYSGSLLLGAVTPMMNVVNLMDIAFALMTVPNIIATVYLAGRVKTQLDIYNHKKNLL